MNDSAPETQTRLFYDERPEGGDETTVNRWAIVALLLGVASVVAVASPLMWVLPIFTIFVGLMALRSIAASEQAVRGRGLVIVALTIACFLGGLAPVRHVSRQRALFAQASQQVEAWVELFREGRFMEAHQLRLGFQERVTADASLVEFYKDTTKRMLYDQFMTTSPTSELVRWNERILVRHIGDLHIHSTSNDDVITQRYDFGVEKDGTTHWMQTEVMMTRRSFREANESRWELKDCKVVSLPANLP